jgi:hypothetical protein
MPKKLTDLELFEESRQITKGEKFEEIYRKDEEALVWQNIEGVYEPIKLKQYCNNVEKFDRYKFDSQLKSNIKMKKLETPTPVQKLVIPIIAKKQSKHWHTDN